MALDASPPSGNTSEPGLSLDLASLSSLQDLAEYLECHEDVQGGALSTAGVKPPGICCDPPEHPGTEWVCPISPENQLVKYGRPLRWGADPFAPAQVIKEDFLLKLPSARRHRKFRKLGGDVLRRYGSGWKKRKVVLRMDSLSWHKGTCRKGDVSFINVGEAVTVHASTSDVRDFRIVSASTSSGKRMDVRFRAKTLDERNNWVLTIWTTLCQYKNMVASPQNAIAVQKGFVSKKKYTKAGRLGEGSFGTVNLCRTIDGNHEVAIKSVDCGYAMSQGNPLRFIEREINILTNLKHQNVIKLHSHFLENNVIYLVTEYCKGGSLNDRILALGKYPLGDAKQVAYELFDALTYCHEKGLMHRDIKPQNILLRDPTRNTSIVLIDFGLSKLKSEHSCMDPLSEVLSCHTPVGSQRFSAPEVFDRSQSGYLDGKAPEKVDVWSAGAVVYNMLHGYPWPPQMKYEASQKEGEGAVPESSGTSSFLAAALTWNPLERPTALEMRSHKWCSGNSPEKP